MVSPISSLGEELPKDISRAALKNFPIDEPKSAFTQELIVSKAELATRKSEFTEWNFHSRNRNKIMTIIPQAFFVKYKNYEKYENLHSEFLNIVDSFFKFFKEAQASRLGLRYINQLDVPGPDPLNWEDYIDKELLGLLSYNIAGSKPSRILHNLEVVFEDFNLRFQFGIHNPDYPAPIRRRAFILDYDAYCQGLLDPNDIPELLNRYHDAIQEIFERSITDKLREAMNEVE